MCGRGYAQRLIRGNEYIPVTKDRNINTNKKIIELIISRKISLVSDEKARLSQLHSFTLTFILLKKILKIILYTWDENQNQNQKFQKSKITKSKNKKKMADLTRRDSRGLRNQILSWVSRTL
jgi:hypothetical protein